MRLSPIKHGASLSSQNKDGLLPEQYAVAARRSHGLIHADLGRSGDTNFSGRAGERNMARPRNATSAPSNDSNTSTNSFSMKGKAFPAPKCIRSLREPPRSIASHTQRSGRGCWDLDSGRTRALPKPRTPAEYRLLPGRKSARSRFCTKDLSFGRYRVGIPVPNSKGRR